MHKDAERAAALLRYANYAKVADALQVSRASVADWAKGLSVTPYRLNQLEQLLRPDLDIEKAPAPNWARELADETVMKVIEAVATPDRLTQMERLIARLEAIAPLPDEASDDRNGSQDPDGPGQPERAVG